MAVSWPARRGRQSKSWHPRTARWIRIVQAVLGPRFLLKTTAGSSTARDRAEAFDRLFQRHERQIFGYLWRMTGDQGLASDLCQETFLRAWQHTEQLAAYRDPVGWLFRVATNLALNAQRGSQRLLQLLVPLDGDDGPTSADPAGSIVDAELVHRILQELSPRARAALVLREVYDLSLVEVAQNVGASPAATKKMLSRAREQFRARYLREGAQR